MVWLIFIGAFLIATPFALSLAELLYIDLAEDGFLSLMLYIFIIGAFVFAYIMGSRLQLSKPRKERKNGGVGFGGILGILSMVIGIIMAIIGCIPAESHTRTEWGMVQNRNGVWDWGVTGIKEINSYSSLGAIALIFCCIGIVLMVWYDVLNHGNGER